MQRHFWMGISLVLTGIFIASNLYTMLPLQKELSETFHVSIAQASLASTFFIFPYAIGLFCFGLLADRFSHKRLLLTGMACLTIVTLLVGMAPYYWLFLLLRGLQGVLAASFAPTAFAYTFQHFQGKQQAFVIAMINTGFLFAGIFGQMIAVYLTGAGDSYQTVYVGFFFFYLLCLCSMAVTLIQSNKPIKKTRISISPILSFFRFPPLLKLYGISFFLLMAVMMFYGSFEVYMTTDHISFPFSLQTFRLIGLIGILPAFFAGPLQQLYGARSVLAAFLLCMTAGILLPLWTFGTITLVIASIFMIASTSITIPMVILLIGTFAKESRASAVSIYSFTLLTGASIGSILAAIMPFHFVLACIGLTFASLSLLSLTIEKPPFLSQQTKQSEQTTFSK